MNRKNENDLTPEDWREIIKKTFKKQHIFVITLVGGEPTMRPDIIQVFCEEMPKRVCVVTNGTYPLKRFENLYFYWVSMDGTEKVHDSIRGEGSYTKTKQNILNYITGPSRNGKPAWKDIWITMTINSLNFDIVRFGTRMERNSKQDRISVSYTICERGSFMDAIWRKEKRSC